ncbi:MAG: hypothetical protein ACXWQ6_11490 [Candidatus Limnocylindrales bacterium]
MTRAARTPAWERPLWTCPDCRQRYVTRNMWHSCAVVPWEAQFEGRPKARALWDALRAMVEAEGPVTVVSTKTGLGFMTRVRFGGCQVRKDYLRCGVWLKRRYESPRIVRLEQWGPRDFGMFFLVREPEDLDDEVRRLFREARAVGDQAHLREDAARMARTIGGAGG